MSEEARSQVLIVDDEELMRRILARSFARKSVPVLLCDTAQEALALDEAAKTELRVVLCDATVSDLDLPTFTENLRAHAPNVEILTTSGYGADHLAHQGIIVDPDRFLQKPWSINELVSRILGIIESGTTSALG